VHAELRRLVGRLVPQVAAHVEQGRRVLLLEEAQGALHVEHHVVVDLHHELVAPRHAQGEQLQGLVRQVLVGFGQGDAPDVAVLLALGP